MGANSPEPAGEGDGALPFNRAVYINLDVSTNRRSSVEKTLTTAKIPFVRRPASTREGAQWVLPERGFKIGKTAEKQGQFESWGIAAAFLSHLAVIKDLSERQELALILEDDVEVVGNFRKSLADAWRSLPENWDIF